MAGDLSSERNRSRELAEKIAKRDPLDVNKVHVLYKVRLYLRYVHEKLDSNTTLWKIFGHETAIRIYRTEIP